MAKHSTAIKQSEAKQSILIDMNLTQGVEDSGVILILVIISPM